MPVFVNEMAAWAGKQLCIGEWSWVSLWAALGMAGESGNRDNPAGQSTPILLPAGMGVGCGKGTAGENFAPCSLGQAYPGSHG